MKKILIIEDNKDVRENTADILELSGYETETAADGKIGVEKTLQFQPDVIVCDIMMPVMDGYDVLEELGKNTQTAGIPFIFLTAKSEKSDFRKGMNLGADDYLTKPFHLAELNSRIKAVLRRGKFGGTERITFNEILIDTRSRTAYINEKSMSLTRKEYDLLLFLVTNKGRVLSKEIIAEHLWGDNSDLADNFDFIYVHINNLRKKLTDAGAKYIKTAYGSGYKFLED